MSEVWKSVPGFERCYEVSSEGRVRSCSRKLPFKSKRGNWSFRVTVDKILVPQQINSGYLVVSLCADGRRFVSTVHSLVAAAFIGPRPKGMDVAHGDGDRINNAFANLRYATRTENHADKKLHGTAARGSRIRQSKLTEAEIPSIRLLKGSMSAIDTAAIYGVSRRTVNRVWRGENWAHV